ncbi:hypothetical protein R2E40_02475 [Aeromonas sp. CD]|nr:hypothetical protein [Aeromonas sp. CD]WOX53009.1 hypothetical protein R2E40_02475 [Aeromonas sp. CD]
MDHKINNQQGIQFRRTKRPASSVMDEMFASSTMSSTIPRQRIGG